MVLNPSPALALNPLPNPNRALSLTPGSLLTPRQPRYLHDWSDFNGTFTRHGNPSRDADRLVEVPGVDDIIAAQLLARLRKWPIGHEGLAVAHADAGRRRDGMQWRCGQIVPVGVQVARQ